MSGIDFDTEKAHRIGMAFIEILNEEKASAGEAVAAASYIFKMACDQAPTPEEADKLRNACIAAMRGPVQ